MTKLAQYESQWMLEDDVWPLSFQHYILLNILCMTHFRSKVEKYFKI